MMRAVFMTGYGRPLEVREAEVPRPGAGEVLVRIEMTGACYRDILTVEGFFPKARPPLILGHEIAGRIAELGEGVEGFTKGERVVSLTYTYCGQCRNCRSGRENICRNRLWYGEDMDGSYAEYIRVKAGSLVKVPEAVPPEGAAIAACVTGMLIHAFQRVARLSENETVLVTGAGGGVGIHAVQIAKALGARVIALTSSPGKVEQITKAGADEVLVLGDKTLEEIKRITGGEGIDLVLESVGQPTFSVSLRALAWGGRIVNVGNVSASSVEIPLGLVILRENMVSGSISSTKQDVEQALEMTARGLVRPIATVLPLEKAQEAHELMKRRESVGRMLFKP